MAGAIKRAVTMEAGVRLTKDLVGGPANYVTPSLLAETAMQIAADTGMTCKILEKDDCVKLKMGSYLAVSQVSSSLPPFLPPCISYTCLHHLIYLPPSSHIPTPRYGTTSFAKLVGELYRSLSRPPSFALSPLVMHASQKAETVVCGREQQSPPNSSTLPTRPKVRSRKRWPSSARGSLSIRAVTTSRLAPVL